MSEELFSIVKYLLPGLLSAWIFYGLCAHKKPEQFERVVQALIFTVIVQALAYTHALLQGLLGHSPTSSTVENILPPFYALLTGVLFSWGANKDFPHRFLRKLGVTEQTSYPSEWFGVLSSHKRYVVLHLSDERRLYGWPKEWPQSADSGHFFISQPAWLVDIPADEDGRATSFESDISENGVEGLLIAAKDVKWIEFMKKA
jgi:Family of unknown function (DUF6338)